MNFPVAAAYAASLGIVCGPQLDEKLALYADFLAEYNEKVNLTAITERSAVEARHFCDSFTAAPCVPKGAKLLDVGSGAGFPGVVLKLLDPSLSLSLLDSNGKKAEFLRRLCERLGVAAEIINDRAENASRRPEYRARFDAVTARAVAAQNVLCEYCLPFLRLGGVFVSMKSGAAGAEIAAAGSAVKLLGGSGPRVFSFTLPDGSLRCVAATDKTSPTPDAYPRPGAKISKKPL